MLSLSLALAMTLRMLSHLAAFHPNCAASRCRRNRCSLGVIFSRSRIGLGLCINLSDNVVDVLFGLGDQFARLASDAISATHRRFDQRVQRRADLRQEFG